MRAPGFLRALFAAVTLAWLLLSGTGSALAAPPLSVYGNLPGFEMASLSPSGERIALVGTVDGIRLLLVINKDKALVTKLQIGPDIKVRGLHWAGDGMVLLQRSNTARLGMDFTTDKAELSSMTVIPLDGGKGWNVFEKNDVIQGGIRGFYGASQRNGKWYGYFGGMTYETNNMSETYLKTSNPVLYEVDLQNHAVRKIANRIEDEADEREWLVGSDGKVGVKLDTIAASGGWSIDSPKKSHIASGVQKLGGVRLIGFGTTPDTFIYSVTDPESGVVHWYETPLAYLLTPLFGLPCRVALAAQATA